MSNDLIDRLTLCANDPMWADHAEVPKPLLTAAAATIAALQAEVERAKEDERDRLFALVKDSPFTPASYFLYNQQGAMLPDERRVARSASRKENTP